MNVLSRFSSLLAVTVLATGLMFAVGCDSTDLSDTEGTVETQLSDTDGSASTNTALVNSHVTQELDQALVTIDEVLLVPTEDTSAAEEDVGISVLTDESFEVDLVALQQGVNETLSETQVQGGEYSQMRLIVENAVDVTFSDGSTGTVTIASGPQTGLKLNFDAFTIDSNDDRIEISVEWNVEDSIQGEQGNLVMTPVVDASVNASGAQN